MPSLIAAIGIAASTVIAAVGFVFNKRQVRRARLATLFADALQALSDFENYPYRVGRRFVDDPRQPLVQISVDVHGGLAYFKHLLRLEAGQVADSFDALIEAAHLEWDGTGAGERRSRFPSMRPERPAQRSQLGPRHHPWSLPPSTS